MVQEQTELRLLVRHGNNAALCACCRRLLRAGQEGRGEEDRHLREQEVAQDQMERPEGIPRALLDPVRHLQLLLHQHLRADGGAPGLPEEAQQLHERDGEHDLELHLLHGDPVRPHLRPLGRQLGQACPHPRGVRRHHDPVRPRPGPHRVEPHPVPVHRGRELQRRREHALAVHLHGRPRRGRRHRERHRDVDPDDRHRQRQPDRRRDQGQLVVHRGHVLPARLHDARLRALHRGEHPGQEAVRRASQQLPPAQGEEEGRDREHQHPQRGQQGGSQGGQRPVEASAESLILAVLAGNNKPLF